MNHDEHILALEVINGTNLIIPSHRVPAGLYVLVSTSSGQWHTAIKALKADCSVAWNEILVICARPPKSSWWPMSFFSGTSTAVHFEIRASFEFGRTLGRGQLVGTVETTLEKLLEHDEQFEALFHAIDNQQSSLLLRTRRTETPQLNGHTTDSSLKSEVGCVTDAAHEAYALYSKSNCRNDLDRAIRGFRTVLEQCPDVHPDRAAALSNLAHAIKNIGTDIDHAISLFRSALAIRPRGHPDHPLSIINLCEALRQRHLRRHDSADVREVAELYSSLLPLCVEGSYLHRVVLDANGVQYVIDECNALPCSPMEESILLRRIILELSADLCERFRQNGDIDDIDRAVQLSRDALAICPVKAGCGSFLGVLCYALKLRFDHHGDPSDLDESIPLYRAALDLCPPFDPARWTSLNNLAEALNARYNKCSHVWDFEEAIRLHQEALALRPRGRPRRDHTLNNIAAAHYTHFRKSEDISALDDAISFYREALELRPPGNQWHCQALLNLASALQERFTQTRYGEHIEEAIRRCQEALESLPFNHPECYFCYVSLQEAYTARFNVQCHPDDLASAFKNCRLAVNLRTQDFPRRIEQVFQWIEDAEKYNHESALEAYQTSLRLLDVYLSTRSSVTSRREAASQLRLGPALSGNAASSAIRRGELVTAVELLERGRALLWFQVSRLRTPPDQLRIARPLLADRFVVLSEQLSAAIHTRGSVFDAADSAAANRAMQQYERLLTQWEVVVAQIRGIGGFSRFLIPPSYDDARLAAQHGPIILLIASEHSCHSLIITHDAEQPCHVPLSITLADVKSLSEDFSHAIRNAANMDPTESRIALIAVLREVWDEGHATHRQRAPS
ncbi:uncharacterized protein EDB91DRAFT_1349369 [Suillus paluster]|uniref:uncharacterized protein n=1 Tax=Suillus paluster TaxID=48578 RepID=UPI001B8762B6|nr:uncharacterized protein EDB91DRAFT_1349369 [Suillus paluster]KAG1731528.1 hypothetical protein EDB91DRAFT_1349369 [Suillus paluster]